MSNINKVPKNINGKFSEKLENVAKAIDVSLGEVVSEGFDTNLKEIITSLLGGINKDFLVAQSYNPNFLEQTLMDIIRQSGEENIKVHIIGNITKRYVVFEDIKGNFISFHINSEGIDLLSISHWEGKDIENQRKYQIKTFLVGLYHKENFPFPRFALGIGIIAGNIRQRNMGKVILKDMQLGEEVNDIVNEIRQEKPEIIGISATFGQQDLLKEFLEEISNLGYSPKVIVGGSLGSLNYEYIINNFPNVSVGITEGEQTMIDFIKYSVGEISLDQVSNIVYKKDETLMKNSSKKNASEHNSIPELDLLGGILDNDGVMSLETCRGCTNTCSFCIRDHKGEWREINDTEEVLPYIKNIFDSHESKKILYLVDEEFVGKKENNIQRTQDIATKMNKFGFKFETSTRINQIYDTNKNKDRHLQRIDFWKALKNLGLNKILFGVESGVNSILKRFNKQTTQKENENGVRLASICGIPFRITYITYDPLMTIDELVSNYLFQGRDDIVLLPDQKGLSNEELYQGIHDKIFIENNKKGVPLYKDMSYMLVSLECFKNSKYTKLVEEEGLIGDENLYLGKNNAEYVDKRIGLMSKYSQLWIDRLFPLSYALKSLLKISEDLEYSKIASIKESLKDYDYNLLGQFLYLVTGKEELLFDKYIKTDHNFLSNLYQELQESGDLNIVFEKLITYQFQSVIKDMEDRISQEKDNIRTSSFQLLQKIIADQGIQSEWKLIN